MRFKFGDITSDSIVYNREYSSVTLNRPIMLIEERDDLNHILVVPSHYQSKPVYMPKLVISLLTKYKLGGAVIAVYSFLWDSYYNQKRVFGLSTTRQMINNYLLVTMKAANIPIVARALIYKWMLVYSNRHKE